MTLAVLAEPFSAPQFPEPRGDALPAQFEARIADSPLSSYGVALSLVLGLKSLVVSYSHLIDYEGVIYWMHLPFPPRI